MIAATETSGVETPTNRKCSFPNCGRDHYAKGLCNPHWAQSRAGKTLRPIFATQRPYGSPPRITCDEVPCPNRDLIGPCHVYRFSKITGGYGGTSFNGKNVSVHVYVWERENGPIPKGLFVDHQCRVRACCNIDHLRLVTPAVNSTENSVGLGAINKAKTHCNKGHEFTPKNTRIGTSGARYCRACSNAWSLANYHAKQAKRRANHASN